MKYLVIYKYLIPSRIVLKTINLKFLRSLCRFLLVFIQTFPNQPCVVRQPEPKSQPQVANEPCLVRHPILVYEKATYFEAASSSEAASSCEPAKTVRQHQAVKQLHLTREYVFFCMN